MRHVNTRFFIICLAATLILLPMVSGYAGAAVVKTAENKEGPSAGAMAADLVVARPLGAASTVLGCAVFIVSLPFSLLGGNTKAVLETAVMKPAAYTFKRPLGEF